MSNSGETFFGFENMKEYKTSILNYAKNSGININQDFLNIFEEVKEKIGDVFLSGKLHQYNENKDKKEEQLKLFTRIFKFNDNIEKLKLTSNTEKYFALIRNTHTFEGRKLLWNKYYSNIGKYNEKYDYLIKNGFFTKEKGYARLVRLSSYIGNLNLELIKKIEQELKNINFEEEANFAELLGENYIYLYKILEKIEIKNLDDLIYLLKLLRDNITYDKKSNNTELKQFYKNLYLIRKQLPNISKKQLGVIKFLLFIKESELNKYLPYITKKNIDKYGDNLTYLIKNSLYSFDNNNDFGIQSVNFNFSKEENKDSIHACEGFEVDTYEYFMKGKKNFYIIKIDGKIIGHIKDEIVKTFLAYENIEDKNGNIILLKGGIYNFDIGNLDDYKKNKGKYGNIEYEKEYKIINISKEKSKEIKIKFLRLISGVNYLYNGINDSKTTIKLDSIWQDFELFKDEIYYKNQ